MTKKIDPKKKIESRDPHFPPGTDAPGILNKTVNFVFKLIKKLFN